MPQYRCQYCARSIRTRAGVNRHIANTPNCHAQWAKSLSAITVDRGETDAPPPPPSPELDAMPQDDDDLIGVGDEFVPDPHPESPPPPEPVQQHSQHATVEEVLDEDDPQNFSRFVEDFPGKAGEPLRHGETLFERMREQQAMDGDSKFAPFVSSDEWDLAIWLSKNVSQTATEEYLQLPIVSNKAKLSFHNNRSFLQKIDALPTGPDWTCELVTVAGDRLDENDEMTSEELELWMRDPVKCIKELMSNPAFKDHMAYAPERVYGNSEGTEDSRIFDEMWTANWWWKIQVQPGSGRST
ncbi:hypothetical protein FB451DRAFT_1019803 [Mycena latifolia]|nr:hypothetical protein FB451DRAFT_1019803 [Mycena latifolia]